MVARQYVAICLTTAFLRFKKYCTLLSCLLVAAAVHAAEFNTIVPDTCAGDIRVTCEDAGEWSFSVQRDVSGATEELIIRIMAPRESVPPRFDVSFEFPQRDMHHVWTDFADRQYIKPAFTSWMSSDLTHGQPLCAIHNGNNRNRFTMACSEALKRVEWRAALREENCLVTGGFRFFTQKDAPCQKYEVRIRFDVRDIFWSDAVQDAAAWIARTAGLKPCTVPDAAFDPLYSSWYSFHQNVFAKDVEDECAIAAKMGMKVLIVDDGWQTDDTNRGYAFCGDWQISPRRFPDMPAHVRRVHEMGLKYIVWYAVPFVGKKSENWNRFTGKYLYVIDRIGAGVLDPRFPEVREFLINTYITALKEWDLDGFKLDFIDAFKFKGEDPAVAENYAGRDIRSLPDAVNRLMSDVHVALSAIKPNLLFEFRQWYIGPAIRQFGNMMRAADCPGDLQGNRMRIANLRLTAGSSAVHADMLEWHPSDSPEAAARPILSAMFGVIQYSMMLRNLPQSHREVIRHWLAFSQKHRDTLLKGSFRAYNPESQYPLLEAESEAERIFGVYVSGMVVPCGKLDRPVYVLNGTGQNEVILELTSTPSCVAAFDAQGREVVIPSLPVAGISRIAVPAGGYVRLCLTDNLFDR